MKGYIFEFQRYSSFFHERHIESKSEKNINKNIKLIRDITHLVNYSVRRKL